MQTKEPETHFLGVRELPETTAGHVYEVMSDLLQEKGLDLSKMAALALDGPQMEPATRASVVSR